MNRLAKFVLISFVLVAVTFGPATTAYYVEHSRWKTIAQVSEDLHDLQEAYLKLVDVLHPFTNPEELEKAKKTQQKFQDLAQSVKRTVVSHRDSEERLSILFGAKLPFITDYLLRTTTGMYLQLGFLLLTVTGFVFLIRFKKRISKTLSEERGKMENTIRSNGKAANQEADRLRLKIAQLEGTIVGLTSKAVEPELAPNKLLGRRKEFEKKPESPDPTTNQQESTQWKLCLVSSDSEKGTMMPSNQEAFTKEMSQHLQNDLAAINPNALHGKLQKICGLDPSVRPSTMDKIKGQTIFRGWYKMRLGSFRILLKFDDTNGILRFFPATHEVYREIYRKRN